MRQINFKKILDNVYSGIYIVDAGRKITYWNKGAEKLTGYSADYVINKKCFNNILMHVNENGKSLCHNGCPLAATIQDGKDREVSVFLRHKQGFRVPVVVHAVPVYDDEGVITGAVETFTDNTSLSNAHHRIARLSDELKNDHLTGISNRKYAEVQIRHSIDNIENFGFNHGLLFIDIDFFKGINDRFGHKTGDKILKMVAKTIAAIVRKNDIVARWGGEEFVVLLEQVNPAKVSEVAEKIRSMVEASGISNKTDTLSVTVSVGATLLQKKETVASAVERVDKLMYKSKESGRNRVSSDIGR